MNVPSAVAIRVEISAISTELVSAFARSGSANGCSQWRSVKPCQVKLKRPWLSLNENRTTMKTGMNRYSSARTDQIPRAQWRRRSWDLPPVAGAGGVVAIGAASVTAI